MSNALVMHITDDTFDSEVINSDLPVLLDYWAPWCGPCRMIAPVLDIMAQEFAGKVKICKINIDDNTKIASQHNIRSIPTLMLFKNGKVQDTAIGSLSQSNLADFIRKNI